jgi:hypothetical protein
LIVLKANWPPPKAWLLVRDPVGHIGIDDKGRIKMSRKAAMKERDAAAAACEGAPAPAEDNG